MADFWTAHIVREHLVQAFRMLPGHAVFSARGTIKAFDAHPATADAFSWAGRFLAEYPKARLHLFAWARCKAQRESWRALCLEMGWPRSSAEISRGLAAELIAEGLNREALGRETGCGS